MICALLGTRRPWFQEVFGAVFCDYDVPQGLRASEVYLRASLLAHGLGGPEVSERLWWSWTSGPQQFLHFELPWIKDQYELLRIKWNWRFKWEWTSKISPIWSVDQKYSGRMVGFLCNECGKSFAEDIDLALHERRTHDKRTFPCEKCGETLVGQSKYSNHMRKHKSGQGKSTTQP